MANIFEDILNKLKSLSSGETTKDTNAYGVEPTQTVATTPNVATVSADTSVPTNKSTNTNNSIKAKNSTVKTYNDFGNDADYERYLVENNISKTKGEALSYMQSKAKEKGISTRDYAIEMTKRVKNTLNTEKLEKNQDTLTDAQKEAVNQFGVIVDSKGNEVDSNTYNNNINLFNETATNINNQITELNNAYTNGQIDYNTMQTKYNELQNKWNENQLVGEDLSNYKTLTGFDYYNWAKENGKDVTEFEKYAESIDDSWIENLTEVYAASVADAINTPVQAYEILKNIVTGEDFTDDNSYSSKLSNASAELRQYAYAGTSGFNKWSTQVIDSLLPMLHASINAMAFAGAIGVGSTAATKAEYLAKMNKATSLGTNIILGTQTAGQVTRQRIQEGNDLTSSVLNGVLHGTITGLVEGFDAGNVASVFTGSAESFLLPMGLFSKASPKNILGYLNAIGVSEGAEEIIETLADHIADNVQNMITGALDGTTLQKVNATELDPSEMANEFVMAYAGAILMGTPTGTRVVLNSKTKYNASQSAKTYFESVLKSDIASVQEKDVAYKSIESINYDQQNSPYKMNSQVSDAITLNTDYVPTVATYEEAMNNLVNAVQSDIQGELKTANETLNKAAELKSLFQEELINRGYWGLNSKGTDTSGIDVDTYMNLSNDVKSKIKTSLDLANNMGANVKVANNFNIVEDGQLKTIVLGKNDNGVHFDGDQIVINPYATEVQTKGADIITGTLAHELTHNIEQNADEYNRFQKIVFETLGSEEVETRRAEIKKAYGDVLKTEADENKEIVAKYIEEQFGNEKFIKQLSDYNSSLLSKTVMAMSELLSTDNNSKIANEFFKSYNKVLNDSVKKANNGKTVRVGEDLISINNLEFSHAQYYTTGRELLSKYLDTNPDITNKEDIVNRVDEMADVMQQFMDTGKFPTFSKWQDTYYSVNDRGELSVVISNGDYEMNIDFSTVCKKRKMMDKVLNELSKNGYLRTNLSKLQLAEIRQVIQDNGLEVACGLCFVDAKRFNQGNWAGRFETKWNGLIDQLVAILDTDDVTSFDFLNGKNEVSETLKNIDFTKPEFKPFVDLASGGSELSRMAKNIINNPDVRGYVTTNDMYGSDGFKAMETLNPTLYKLAYASGGSSKPKTPHSEITYNAEIITDNKFNPEESRKVGGVRVQSFSDFMTNMVFDYIEMFSNMEAKQLTCHSYTKVKEYALLFGKTGAKINLSIIPAAFDISQYSAEQIASLKETNKKLFEQLKSNAGLDQNGNYIFDKESFNWELAKEIQSLDGYDKNVGTICVGVSDKHIWKLLEDNDVKMVIPYHRSGISDIVASKMGIALYNDYTLKQNTRMKKENGKAGKKVGKGFDFDFYNGSNDNNGNHYNGLIDNGYDAKATAQAYLEWCNAQNYVPKFDTFAYNEDGSMYENYYKLLIDFRAYDNKGNIAPQESVSVTNGAFTTRTDIENGVIPIQLSQEQTPLLYEMYGNELVFDDVLEKGLDISESEEQTQNEKLNPITEELIDRLGLRHSKSLSELSQPSNETDASGNTLSVGMADYLSNSIGDRVDPSDINSPHMEWEHGSPNATYTEFDNSKEKIRGESNYVNTSKAIYLTSSHDVASTYSGTDNVVDPNNIPKIDTVENIKQYVNQLGGDVVKIGDLYYITDIGNRSVANMLSNKGGFDGYWDLQDAGDLIARDKNGNYYDDIYALDNPNDYETVNALTMGITEDQVVEFAKEHFNLAGNYKLYAKSERPFIIEAKGRQWNQIDTPTEMAKSDRYNDFIVSTRDIENWFYENLYGNGYDSIRINNVIDNGRRNGKSGTSDILVVFNSNQIKSVSNLTPTTNSDIRYSKGTDIDKLTLEEEARRIDQLIENDLWGDAEAVRKGLQNIRNEAGVRSDKATMDTLRAAEKAADESVKHIENATDKELRELAEQVSAMNVSEEALKGLQEFATNTKTTEVLSEPYKKETNSNTLKTSLYNLRQKIVDKGEAIRKIARKNKNDTLQAFYDHYLSSNNIANSILINGINTDTINKDNSINEGKKVKGLRELSSMIPEDQKNDFDTYMYHFLNTDTAKVGKNVFNGVSAEESWGYVQNMEKIHPEWLKVAQGYWDNTEALLNYMVEHERFSENDAKMLRELYPHYVPIVRAMLEDTEVVETDTKGNKFVSTNAGAIKERTGGSQPLQPLDYAMEDYTRRVVKSSLLNDFAKEYVVQGDNVVPVLFTEMFDGADRLGNLDYDAVMSAQDNQPATMVWYDKGEKKIMQIPQGIYDALDYKQTPFSLPDSKVLTKLNQFRRNLITGKNPLFMITNPIKDAQEIIYNSKHALATYGKLPKAFWELCTNGEVARYYKENGGEYMSLTSEGIKDNSSKFYKNTIGRIEQANNIMELTPRLAEFMASIEKGRTKEQALYDAAEVTCNFKRGGDYAKWADRNGATFLNASIQGMDKQVRMIQDAYDHKGWKGVLSHMVKATLLYSLPLMVINALRWKDDEDYEQLSDYIKDNYYILFKYGDGKFFRIPKGRVAAAYQGVLDNIYENGVELASDDSLKEKAVSIWVNSLEGIKSAYDNIGVNNPLSNNIFAPAIQTINNETWYGDPIVSEYMAIKDNAEQYDYSTDKFSVWLGKQLDLSPKKINYLLDQYSGAIGDVLLPVFTPKAETGLSDGSVVGNVAGALLSPLADKFTTDSVFKNQDVTDFYTMVDELYTRSAKENASDEEKLAYKYMNSIKSQMNKLYTERNDIYNSDLNDKDKYAQAKEVQKQVVELAQSGLATYDQIDKYENYAEIGGIGFTKDEDGNWTKANTETVDFINDLDVDNKVELKQRVLGATGITENGKTVRNSKALEVADAYADMGVLDDVFAYIEANGIDPTEVGLNKTVASKSYEQIKSSYEDVYGEVFGNGDYQPTTSQTSNTSTNTTIKSKKGVNAYFNALKGSGSNYYSGLNINTTKVSDVNKKVDDILKNL